MQDKEKIDADFLDSAWADMHSRLDEHMPVQKSRRKGFLYWRWALAAAFLLLLSLPTCWYLQEYQGNQNVNLASDEAPITPSATIPTLGEPQQKARMDDAQIGTAELLIEGSASNPIPEPTNPINSNDVIVTQSAKSNSQIEASNIDLQQLKMVTLEPIEEVAIAVNESGPNPTQEEREERNFNPLRTIYEAQSIPSLDHEFLAIEKRGMPDLRINRPRIATAMYVEADGFMNPTSALISGFGLGIGRQAPLVGKLKWNIGLAYRFNRWYLNASQDQARVLTNADAAFGLSDDILLDGSSNAVSVLASVIKEHAIEVPLSLSLQTGNHWQFDAGIAASYAIGTYAGNIRASADAAGGFTPEAQTVFNDLAAASTSWYGGNSDTQVVKDRLNTIRLDADLSINYRLSSRWGLQVQGRYNITPPLKREFVELSNTTIGLGLRYYIK